MRFAIIVTALALASSCGGTAADALCAGVSGTCKSFSAGAKESDIAGAFATAKTGTTIVFGPGTFAFTNTLTLAVASNITIQGAGNALTTLDFSGQAAGSEGIDVQDNSNSFKLANLKISNTAGDAVKVIGSTGVTFLDVTVEWTGADNTKHGAYGLYPVQSKNITIDGCTVSGASDSGIYVGQSQNIIVKNNTVTRNVAGIEIENSFNADVTNNTATLNTAGILVFDLPDLQQEGGHDVRVFGNTITDNNTPNFAAQGDIVSVVPAGTGSFVMANHDVEVFGNTISGNGTAGFSVVSYFVTQLAINDANYYPFPVRVYAHDNTFANNGTAPDANSQLGLLLASGFGAAGIPSMLYDGIPDPRAMGGTAANPMQICFANNTASTYADLNFELLNPDGTNLADIVSTDSTAVTCTLPALPAVTF